MEVWLGFLLFSFAAGGRAAARGRRERLPVLLALCVAIAGALLFERFA